jgi:general secretion pathway protein K
MAAACRQRGAALLMALLAVALAVLMATALIDTGEASRARLRDQWRAEQSWQLMTGLELWAAELLRADHLASPGLDTLDDALTRPLPEIEVPGARISGRLRDLGSCFDLNRLAPLGQPDPVSIEGFRSLLGSLRLDPRIADQAADWIDADGQPQSAGAEDGNTAMVHRSELKRLPAVDAAAWLALQPLLCALPEPTPVNLNTAPPEVWLTVFPGLDLARARRLARQPGSAYRSTEALTAALAREDQPAPDPRRAGLSSRYFLAEARIEADGIDFLYTSLLERDGERVRVLGRARGIW